MKAGLEKDKAAVLVVIGLSTAGIKHVLGGGAGYRESTESWKAVFWKPDEARHERAEGG